MGRARMLGGATRTDILLGALGAAAIEFGSITLIDTPARSTPLQPSVGPHSIPVRVVTEEVPALGAQMALGGRTPRAGAGEDVRTSAPGTMALSTRKGHARVRQQPAPEVAAALAPPSKHTTATLARANDERPPGDTPTEAPHAADDLRLDAVSPEYPGPDAELDEGYFDGLSAEGFPDGISGGTITDPLVARAIRLYRQRLRAWFAQRFRISGAGLSQSDLERLQVLAVVYVNPQRRVSGYTIVHGSGHRVFDAAAVSALESVDGLEVPPPPTLYPGPLQGVIRVTFVCREGACD